MPESVVKKVTAQCNAGKRPSVCGKKMSCSDCGEKVAAIVDAKAKKRRKLAGGTVDSMTAFGAYTQAPIDYEVVTDGDGGQWHRVMDWDARLLDRASGQYRAIDETGLMATLGGWVTPTYPKYGNIDHNMEKAVGVDILDARYEIKDGLYLKVRPEDEDLAKMLASGQVRMSPEFKYEENDVRADGIVDFVVPVGIGFMLEGEPLSPGSGAALPSTDAIPHEMVGGTNVTDDEDKDAQQGNDKEDHKPSETTKNPEPTAPDTKALETLQKEMEELKAEFDKRDALLKEALQKNADLEKVRAEADAAEKARLAKALPDGYDVENATVNEMKRDIVIYQEGIKKAQEGMVSGPQFEERDHLPGTVLTEEEYKAIQDEERRMLGFANVTPSHDSTVLPERPNYKNP